MLCEAIIGDGSQESLSHEVAVGDRVCVEFSDEEEDKEPVDIELRRLRLGEV